MTSTDFNGDVKIDLAVINYISKNVSALLNNNNCSGSEILNSTQPNIFIQPNPNNGAFKMELESDAKTCTSNATG